MRRIGKIRVDHVAGTKLCPDCETVKPIADFPVRGSGTLYTYCKVCNAHRAVEWSAKNKDRKAATNAAWHTRRKDHVRTKAKDNHYKRSYGISTGAVISMLESQNSKCAICCTEVTINTLVVDHCHDSAKVRGILCNLCNISLAPLEKAEWFASATAYLERHRSAG